MLRNIIYFLFVYIVYYLTTCCISFATEHTMFSGKILYTANNEYLVVKDNVAFIRYIDGDKFAYRQSENQCYNLENDIKVCIKDNKVDLKQGYYHNVFNDNRAYKNTYTDEFFNEKNLECDLMKFDIIYYLFVKNITLEAFETQLYLPDFFSILRLIVYHNLYKDDNKMYAFILSDKNEVGCSHYNEYTLYTPKIEDENNDNQKKNNKNSNIIAKNQAELLKKISEETYKQMLLEDYIYLQPANNRTDIANIVLTLHNTEIKDINALSLDFEWQKFEGRYFYTDYTEKNDNNKDNKNLPSNNKKKKKKKNKKGFVEHREQKQKGLVGAVMS